MSDIKLEGFDEFIKFMKNLPFSEQELEQVVKAGGVVAEGEMKLQAQRMGVWDTGATANSIYNRTASMSTYDENASSARSKQPGVELRSEDRPNNEKDYVEARIGPSTEYAAKIEYGTSKMAARPFVRQTLQSAGGNVVKAMTAVTKKKIEQKAS